MKTLKRKHARLALVLLGLTIPSAAVPWLACDVLGRDSLFWGVVGVGGATAFSIAALFVIFCFLRCPGCGKTIAGIRWNSGGQSYCPRCGEPFIFDDEPEESEE